MEQYFGGHSTEKLYALTDQNSDNVEMENKLFINERIDDKWNKTHLKIHNSTFAKIGFRKSKFKLCDLSFCVFIDCYFKRASFEQINFISCIFINCNFDMARFSNCDFRYATFENCYIPFSQMYSNLPHGQENLCADICKNLSMQCLKQGMVEDYKAYLFEERASGEIHSWKKMFHENDSYYARYNFFDGLKGMGECARSKASKFVWGYGERMSVLLRNMLIAVSAYAAVYFLSWDNIIWDSLSSNRIISALYFSACNFFSVSTETAMKTQMLQFIGLSEHIIGLIFMGFFGAALFRQINRR